MIMEGMKRKFNHEMKGKCRGDEFRSKVHIDYWSLDLQSQMAPRMLCLCVMITITIPETQ